jgi:23S rRNA (adenine2503-C2)-methyltransferase
VTAKFQLLEKTRAELGLWIKDRGEPLFRAGQIWSWIYQKRAASFEEMTSLSKEFRKSLSADTRIGSLRLADKSESHDSGTVKYLWELEDGLRIESVFIPEKDRRTICLSSQVGCPLACTFCATGRTGFVRHLKTHEIVDQVLSTARLAKENPTNLVVMGMGEPFLNYDPVMKALDILHDPDGAALGHRRITVSTSGIIPGIERYGLENRPYKLAVSLNATTHGGRSALMPINETYPLARLLEAIRDYTHRTGRRVTFEYVLIRGTNDTADDARRLLRLLHGIPCKVNLIPFNPTSSLYQRPGDDQVLRFAERIMPLSAPVTLRMSRGQDIQGACGQLAVQQEKCAKRSGPDSPASSDL